MDSLLTSLTAATTWQRNQRERQNMTKKKKMPMPVTFNKTHLQPQPETTCLETEADILLPTKIEKHDRKKMPEPLKFE